MKILILRFSSIGDIVLTTPVIRCLATQLEGAELHYATKSDYTALLTPNPYIAKLHVFRDSLWELIKTLRAEQYDLIIDLHHNLRTAAIKASMPHIPSRSFDKKNIHKWLYVQFKQDGLGDEHIVDRYLATVSSLGVVNDGMGLDFFFEPNAQRLFDHRPQGFVSGYHALVIGAKQGTKTPPMNLLQALCAGSENPLVLIGGPEDEQKGRLLESEFPAKVWNTAGSASLQESAFLLKNAIRVVSPDTGMMHIASAFQKSICSIWGNTTPRLGMYPYLSKTNAEHAVGRGDELVAQVDGLNCRPCSKIGYSHCPKGHFRCMQDQNIPAILKWLNQP